MAAALLQVGIVLALAVAGAARAEAPIDRLYQEQCAVCHGAARYGGYAPPLIPEALASKSDEQLERAILEGLPSTQMPAFGERLAPGQARRLVALLREPVPEIAWGAAQIAASRVEEPVRERRIPPGVRREELLLVVERATGSLAVLDGEGFRELDRFVVGPIHGGPKFDRDLRKVYVVTRDGTLAEYDLLDGGLRTRAKVGVNSRNVAVSSDAGFVAVANQLPAGLVLLDGRLHPLSVIPLPGQPSGVYAAPGEDAFLLALRDVPKLFHLELPGLVLREHELPEPFEDFTFVPGTRRVVASSREGERLLLYDLDARRVVASLVTRGLPHLFSGCFFEREGRLLAAFNHVGTPRLSIVDMESFRVVREIELQGSGYFVRTHPGTPFLWADTQTEEIQLVAKDTLELLPRTVRPEPGKTAMHVEFDAAGTKALVSVWHEQGAVVVYDSRTLEERQRLPFAMPVGKYNAHNATRFTRP